MPIQTCPHLFSAAAAALAFAAFGLTATGLTACGPRPDPLGPMPGRTHRPRADSTVPTPAPSSTAPTRWPHLSELPSYRVAIPRSPSQHFAADHDAETLTSPAAASYPDLGPAISFPGGAVIVQRLYPIGAPTPDVLFVMEKRTPDTWTFLVLDPAGTPLDPTALEACARCHAEAPHAGLFGRPR